MAPLDNRAYRILDQGGGGVETKIFGYEAGTNLVDEVEANSVVTRTFAHDAAGNMTTDTRSGFANQYAYNHAGRMESVSTGGRLKASYLYNAFEQLVSRTLVNMTPSGTV